MSNELPPPEPHKIVQLVENYVDEETGAYAKHPNRNPFDEDGMYGLHQLAATIYAEGHAAGAHMQRERAVRARFRAREQ